MSVTEAARPSRIRIGNASGFYGDRLAAMREMLDGGQLDVLTGDYLAELTMLILGRDRLRDRSLGYARTFLRQLEDCLGLALDRGVSIVANAGGLNPEGLAAAVSDLAGRLGLSPKIAYVTGDDLLPRAAELGFGEPVAANAYLGGWGIAACLQAGANVVVTGRVTDASLVVGPAAAHFGWGLDDFDALAGRHGGRPRHRVRRAGHGRQLLVLHRGRRPAPSRASRSPRSRPMDPASSPSTRAPAAPSPSAP